MEKDKFDLEKEGKFDNLKFDLEISPYSWLYFDGEVEITPKNQAIENMLIEISVRPDDDFHFDMAYLYDKLADTPKNKLLFDVGYKLNEKWRLGLYERFDLHDLDVEEQRLSVTRDLHCWEVDVSVALKGSNFLEDELTVWVAFRLKAFPDLQLGLDRSYEKRPPGSMTR